MAATACRFPSDAPVPLLRLGRDFVARRPNRSLGKAKLLLSGLVVIGAAFMEVPPQAEEPSAPKSSSSASEPKPSENPSAAKNPFPANGPMPPLILLETKPMEATVNSLSDGKIQFQASDGKTVSAAMEQLVRWGTPAELPRGPVVLLADGSLLVGQVPRMAAMLLEVEPDLLQPTGQKVCRIPVGQAAGVVFRLPGSLADRDRLLDQIQRQPAEEDRLLLLNGDELRGRLETIGNPTVRFAGPLGPMDVEVSRIRAVQFRRTSQTPPGPKGLRIWVGLQDGSLLLAHQLRIQQSKVHLTLSANLSLQTEQDHLVFLQPIGGQVLYLSDLEPKQYQFEPFFEISWPWQPDRSVTGSWLRSGGRRYLKGLGVHSKARLMYELRGRYRWLEAELALDETARGGSVIYRVLADGKQLYQSPPVSTGDPPIPIRLPLDHAQLLELVVDYGPWGDRMDRANWLDARLIPAPPQTAGPAEETKSEKKTP